MKAKDWAEFWKKGMRVEENTELENSDVESAEIFYSRWKYLPTVKHISRTFLPDKGHHVTFSS